MNYLLPTLAASLMFCAIASGCGGNVEVTGGGPGPDGTGGTGGTSGNACEQAAAAIIGKYTACGIEVSSTTGSGPGECTPDLGVQATCVADCTDDASCETLKGEDQDGAVAYAECLGGC